jgi:nicotinate-nucleotide--dimethylbenzimidazole phosphoribosyltransferase
VLLDGFPTTAAALIAARLQVDIPRYCFAGHLSQEPGHRIALDFLGLRPLLNLDMRLGEGTGAVLGMSIVQAACRCLNEMATFSEAAVRDRIA